MSAEAQAMDTKTYQLFFVKDLADFPDGTLFELENQRYSHAQISKASNERIRDVADWEYETKGYLLPDRGDGVQAIVPEEKVMGCAPFSQNFSPLKGRIQVTKTTTKSLRFPDAPAPSNVPVGILARNQVSVFQNIHFQRLLLELNSEPFEIEQISVFNKVKDLEVECYYAPSPKKENGKWIVSCEFSHIMFGFYEVKVQFTNGWYYSIDLIKHFPEGVKEKYPFSDQFSAISGQRPVFTPIPEIGFDLSEYDLSNHSNAVMSTNQLGFSDALLNDAMELSIEWGENYRKPIYERLHKKYPQITAEEAEKIQKHCREAESYIYAMGEKELNGDISEADIVPLAQRKYPWVNARHWYRLKNIAMFYARK